MLSEISQRKTDIVHVIIYILSLKKKMNVYSKTETDSQIKKSN